MLQAEGTWLGSGSHFINKQTNKLTKKKNVIYYLIKKGGYGLFHTPWFCYSPSLSSENFFKAVKVRKSLC